MNVSVPIAAFRTNVLCIIITIGIDPLDVISNRSLSALNSSLIRKDHRENDEQAKRPQLPANKVAILTCLAKKSNGEPKQILSEKLCAPSVQLKDI